MIKETLRSGRAVRIAYFSLCVAWQCDFASSLTCHCLDNARCNAQNGFCANGCDSGWYGPGCQVGNLALGKPAVQSTTYNNDYIADRAVDGKLPPSNSPFSALQCSTTAETRDSNAWWYVNLSSTGEVYQITNVTIVSRNGFLDRLSNFSILYTNDTAEPPSPDTWSACTSWANAADILVSNYSCSTVAIAKKVAVYLGKAKDNVLTLCEVYICGFEFNGCRDDHVGPGCLLQSCNSDACKPSSFTCDQYGGCQFSSCPSNRFFPPGCWITVPDLSNSSVTTVETCNSIRVYMAQPVQVSDLSATSYLIQVTALRSGERRTVRVPAETLGFTNFSVSASPGRTYSIHVVPETCPSNAGCSSSNDGDCTSTLDCAPGIGTNPIQATTGFRTFNLEINGSCIFVNVDSATKDCEEIVAILIKCGDNKQISNSSTGPHAIVCGLVPGNSYDCTINATISDGSVELKVERVLIKAEPQIDSTPTSSPPAIDGGAVGGAVGGILLVIAIVVAVVFIHRRKRTNHRSASDTVSLHPTDHPRNLTAVIVEHHLAAFSSEAMDSSEPTYGNTLGMTLQQLDLYVKDESLIANRFSEILANANHPCTIGKDPANKSKNRFRNIIPYDASRVTLGNSSHGYINASYINGFSQPKKYIATQGPSSATVNDFWHMVWEQQATVIVMLTNFVEAGKKKCEVYFPKPGTEDCPISVTIQSQTIYDTHTISLLDVQLGTEVRTVSHYHLMCWRDQSVPEHCAEMLLFYTKFAAQTNKRHHQNHPIVVHCSAGVGRTGVFIAFDYLWNHYETERRVDFDSCVVALRDQRMQMVQTKEQYVFLHKIILYSMKTLHFIIDSSALSAYVQKLSQRGHPSNKLAEEWKVLQECSLPSNDCEFAVARLQENAGRNRDKWILASDTKRPIISGGHGATQSVYINAVYCNGCYSDKEFIATQLPLPETVSDFWQMVYDCRASCIVLLHDMPPNEDCPEYWPKTGEVKYFGQYVVSHVGQGKMLEDAAYHEMDFSVRLSKQPGGGKMEELPIKMFRLNVWSRECEVPEGPHLLVDFAMRLTTFGKGAREQPIVVQCRDGASHCGLFISAMNALHRLVECNQVQAFHSVDLARASRYQFVQSQVQYLYIYEFLQSYCETVAIYANA